ncbi:hypothetical protein AJ80_01264 [Polytolypa hystricis UAMH7299]|uniref:Cytochrome P450 n=1 Tax=Polytolypa hystricis (strain UAMH7299) TaxID=1447883 RepID=A0A2B7Z1S5_POLH7|nr:hypothetical protein AJ80_01264 [Polytolypa hystricis UAMH7299]
MGTFCARVWEIIRACVNKTFSYKPKPPHSFILGHLGVFNETVKFFPPNTHPQAYYTALTQNRPSDHGPSYPMHEETDNFLTPIVGKDVIAAANGKKWKMLHHIMAPVFKPAYIKSMLPTIADETMLFHGRLTCAAESGEVVLMEDTVANFVFDVIGRFVFNFPLHAQTIGSQVLGDIRVLLESASLAATTTWNPVAKVARYLKKRAAVGRLDSYISEKLKERYSIVKESAKYHGPYPNSEDAGRGSRLR